MPTATSSDVKDVISTNLSASDINDSIQYAAEWNESANTPSNQTTTETKNIERWAAIINIREYKEPAVEEDSAGDSSAVYEGGELARAKAELSNWLAIAGEDPSGASSLIRDSKRYVTSSGS